MRQSPETSVVTRFRKPHVLLYLKPAHASVGRAVFFPLRRGPMRWNRELRRPLRRFFAVENFETRTVLTDSVSATLDSGVLTLTGDASANQLAIYSGASP